MTNAFRVPEAVCTMVNNALAEKRPMLLAYVASGGQPVLSYRGSVQVYGPSQLSIWIRNPQGGLCGSIADNPRVSLMYRNETTRATYQFRGRARLESDDAVRARVYESIPQAEKDHDPDRSGAVLLVDLDRIDGWAGVGAKGPIDPISLVRGS